MQAPGAHANRTDGIRPKKAAEVPDAINKTNAGGRPSIPLEKLIRQRPEGTPEAVYAGYCKTQNKTETGIVPKKQQGNETLPQLADRYG